MDNKKPEVVVPRDGNAGVEPAVIPFGNTPPMGPKDLKLVIAEQIYGFSTALFPWKSRGLSA